jgi:hypothetical protein
MRFLTGIRQRLMTSRAWVSGLLEMRIRPPKGVCSSVVIRIAVPIPTAQRKIMAIAVILCGANKPKLTKMTMNQNMTSSSRGNGIPLALSSCPSCQRAAIIVPMRSTACGCSHLCVAFVGVRARTCPAAPPERRWSFCSPDRLLDWSPSGTNPAALPQCIGVAANGCPAPLAHSVAACGPG